MSISPRHLSPGAVVEIECKTDAGLLRGVLHRAADSGLVIWRGTVPEVVVTPDGQYAPDVERARLITHVGVLAPGMRVCATLAHPTGERRYVGPVAEIGPGALVIYPDNGPSQIVRTTDGAPAPLLLDVVILHDDDAEDDDGTAPTRAEVDALHHAARRHDNALADLRDHVRAALARTQTLTVRLDALTAPAPADDDTPTPGGGTPRPGTVLADDETAQLAVRLDVTHPLRWACVNPKSGAVWNYSDAAVAGWRTVYVPEVEA